MATTLPLIAVSACRRQLGAHPFHVVGEKYISAVLEVAGGLPLLLPALGPQLDLAALLERVDGILLTGSPSNVEPQHYQGPASDPGTLHDPYRDATTLPLIRLAVAAGVPIMGICRGFQEMNVAFGGSLCQRVHERPGIGMLDHREDPQAPLEVQYGPAHPVKLVPGGWMAQHIDREHITVNSVHWQGIERLGAGLAIEAFAPDGLIEAFRVADACGFTLAVQWHPEWQASTNPVSVTLFSAFGAACRARAAARHS